MKKIEIRCKPHKKFLLFPLLCPKCKAELLVTGYSRHETIIEHVEDPNGEPTVKPEYRCPNHCFPHHIYWDYLGDVFVGCPWWKSLIYYLHLNRLLRVVLCRPNPPDAIVVKPEEEKEK